MLKRPSRIFVIFLFLLCLNTQLRAVSPKSVTDLFIISFIGLGAVNLLNYLVNNESCRSINRSLSTQNFTNLNYIYDLQTDMSNINFGAIISIIVIGSLLCKKINLLLKENQKRELMQKHIPVD